MTWIAAAGMLLVLGGLGEPLQHAGLPQQVAEHQRPDQRRGLGRDEPHHQDGDDREQHPRAAGHLAGASRHGQAPLGVVLRRGPSAWSRLSLWHTDDDSFEHGQWFRGRVYERRADLSADGQLFVYFARRAARPAPTDLASSWIAISRPPWFRTRRTQFTLRRTSSGTHSSPTR